MTIDECLDLDSAVLVAVQAETEEIAEMVRKSFLKFNHSTEEYEETGLDRELVGKLADQILARRRLTIGTKSSD